MKDSHIYQRMNNTKVMAIYMNMINTSEEKVAKELFANVTKEASDHPRYSNIKAAYDKRFGTVE